MKPLRAILPLPELVKILVWYFLFWTLHEFILADFFFLFFVVKKKAHKISYEKGI